MPGDTEFLLIEKSPAITGLRFRHIRGEQDAEALSRVHDQCANHDQTDRLSSIEHTPTQEDLARSLSKAVQEERASNWLIAQIAAEVVGYRALHFYPVLHQ